MRASMVETASGAVVCFKFEDDEIKHLAAGLPVNDPRVKLRGNLQHGLQVIFSPDGKGYKFQTKARGFQIMSSRLDGGVAKVPSVKIRAICRRGEEGPELITDPFPASFLPKGVVPDKPMPATEEELKEQVSKLFRGQASIVPDEKRQRGAEKRYAPKTTPTMEPTWSRSDIERHNAVHSPAPRPPSNGNGNGLHAHSEEPLSYHETYKRTVQQENSVQASSPMPPPQPMPTTAPSPATAAQVRLIPTLKAEEADDKTKSIEADLKAAIDMVNDCLGSLSKSVCLRIEDGKLVAKRKKVVYEDL